MSAPRPNEPRATAKPWITGEMIALWTAWVLMVGLAVAMSACKSPGFKGKGNSRGPEDANFATGAPGGGAGDGNGNFQGSPGGGTSGGGGATAGGNPGGGGIDTSNGAGTMIQVPMKVRYEAKEGTECALSSCYKGTYEFTLKTVDKGEARGTFSFAAGSKTTEVTLPNACTCGQKNNLDLYIKADNSSRNLQGWKQEVMTSHNPPPSGSDWDNWLDKIKEQPKGPAAVYLGGFDHIFIFGTGCGSFACDDRKWNNRDDVKVLFTCQVDQCPQQDQNFSLDFVGMDP